MIIIIHVHKHSTLQTFVIYTSASFSVYFMWLLQYFSLKEIYLLTEWRALKRETLWNPDKRPSKLTFIYFCHWNVQNVSRIEKYYNMNSFLFSDYMYVNIHKPDVICMFSTRVNQCYTVFNLFSIILTIMDHICFLQEIQKIQEKNSH